MGMEGVESVAEPRRKPLIAHRIVVYASGSRSRRWIDEELIGEPETVLWVETASCAREMLTHISQILIVDVESLAPGDVAELQQARDDGWAGRLIALGHVAPVLRRRLHVTHEIGRPLGSETLRVLVSRGLRTSPAFARGSGVLGVLL
jgi:hypothetical protein